MAIVGLAVCAGRIYAPRAALVLGMSPAPQRVEAPAEPTPPTDAPVQLNGADPNDWLKGLQ